jgi:hypothetical protein
MQAILHRRGVDDLPKEMEVHSSRPPALNEREVFLASSGGGWKEASEAAGSSEAWSQGLRETSSCGLNGKCITSVAAIVAPHPCTLVRDAASVNALARPA